LKHLMTTSISLQTPAVSPMIAAPAKGKAATVKTTFSRETTVSTEIHADAAIVWALLTHANDYSRWNSTVLSLEGNIASGEKIRLRAALAPKRIFKLKVKEMQEGRKLVWGDSQGTRVYTLTPIEKNEVTFTMTEKIGGLMFPMYAKYIPSFDQSFEQFAADLKAEAELIQG
jgi:uncharacterized protein YndB with AHSA1/START domain